MFPVAEEIINLIMVWFSFFISSCYCYSVSKMVPQATLRFLVFLPVLCLFFLLPLTQKSINLVILSVFFITWIATFKVLLLVFSTGPLSNPSLSGFHFVLIFCLPLAFQQRKAAKSKDNNPIQYNNIYEFVAGIYNFGISTYKTVRTSIPYFAKRGLIMILLITLVLNKQKLLPTAIALLLETIYIYVVMEVILGAVSIVGQILLGNQVEIEQPFNKPYLSTSLQDFWGRRWNLVASSILHSSIFQPILHCSSQVLGRKWAALVAVLITYVVSDLMHEIMFYYMGRVRFGWGTPLFFLTQGVCVSIEGMLTRRLKARWEVPEVIIGPMIFGFVVCTFAWLVLAELSEYRVPDRIFEEYADVAYLAKDLVLEWSKVGYHFEEV